MVIDEHVHASAAVRQAAALTDFADKPLVVLTAGSGHDAARTTAQNHLATLSTDSVHRVIVLIRLMLDRLLPADGFQSSG